MYKTVDKYTVLVYACIVVYVIIMKRLALSNKNS